MRRRTSTSETYSERDDWKYATFHAAGIPTLAQQRELFGQLTAGWMRPYRAQHTHVVSAWSSDSEETYQKWQRLRSEMAHRGRP